MRLGSIRVSDLAFEALHVVSGRVRLKPMPPCAVPRDILSNRGRDEAIKAMTRHVGTCRGCRGHVFRDQRFLSRLTPADKNLAARRLQLFLWLRLCSGFRLTGVEEKEGLQPRAPLGPIEALIVS